MTTRRALLTLPLLATPAVARAQEGWPRRVTDMVGRQVVLPRPPRRVLMSESSALLNLLLVHPDPVPLLVGIGGDLRRMDPAALAALTRRFPPLADVPEVTHQVGQEPALEQIIALQPDLVVMAAWQHRRANGENVVRALEQAGIAVIFVDFFINPLSRALPSLLLLGEALDCRDAAAAYASFYEAERDRVRAALAGRPSRRVLLQAFAGRWPCCWVAGNQGGGEMLRMLGAENVAAPYLPNASGGNLTVEQMLLLQPDVYIGTGVTTGEGGPPGISLGFGVDPAASRQSLAEVVKAPELAELPAIRQGRAFGLWNPLGGTALNVVALQAVAGWLHPELARSLDPAATMDRINSRFAAVPWEGSFWTSLPT